MHSVESLRDIRALEHVWGPLGEEPPRYRNEPLHGHYPKAAGGKQIARAVFNLKTGELKIYPV